MASPEPTDLADARNTITRAREVLQRVRRRKLPKREAAIIHGLLGPGSERARALAALPDCARWREAFESAALELERVRDEAQHLL